MPTKKSTAAKPAAKRTPRPAAPKLEAVPNLPELPTVDAVSVTVEVMEPAAFEALDRMARIELMKAEAAATRDWIAGGRVGDEPARPVNNAYTLNVLAGGGSVKFAGNGERKSRSNFQPDALAEVLHRITEMREAGTGWPTIAKTFNDEGLPTAKGGQWHSSTVMSIAKRAGMATRLDKPEVVEAPKPSRRRAAK